MSLGSSPVPSRYQLMIMINSFLSRSCPMVDMALKSMHESRLALLTTTSLALLQRERYITKLDLSSRNPFSITR